MVPTSIVSIRFLHSVESKWDHESIQWEGSLIQIIHE